MIRLPLNKYDQTRKAMNQIETINRLKKMENVDSELRNLFPGTGRFFKTLMDATKPWYCNPEIQKSPLVVNIWGVTGGGKTEMVRAFARSLDMDDDFFEFNCARNSPSEIISKIKTLTFGDKPFRGIFLIDDFQHLIKASKSPINDLQSSLNTLWQMLGGNGLVQDEPDWEVKRIREVYDEFDYWFKNGLTVENGMISDYHPEMLEKSGLMVREKRRSYEDAEMEESLPPKFVFSRYESKVLFNSKYHDCLTYEDFIAKIKTMDGEEIKQFMDEILRKAVRLKSIDLSQSLFFTVGILDEVFGFPHNLPLDHPVDHFHFMSRRITRLDLQRSLLEYIKPSQLNQLGNHHLIFPTISEEGYRAIIKRELQKRTDIFLADTGLPLEFDQTVADKIYEEGVMPTLGVKPLIASINHLIGTYIPNLVMSLQMFPKTQSIKVTCEERKFLTFLEREKRKPVQFSYPMNFEISQIRHFKGRDLESVVALHESGHAVLFIATHHRIPRQINSVSTDQNEGGFVYQGNHNEYVTYKSLKKTIMTSLGGYEAEKMVLGQENVSDGSAQDLELLNQTVLTQFCENGLGGSVLHYAIGEIEDWQYKFKRSEEMEQKAADFILKAQSEAAAILKKEERLLLNLTKVLMEKPVLFMAEIRELAEKFGTPELVNSLDSQEETVREILIQKIEEFNK